MIPNRLSEGYLLPSYWHGSVAFPPLSLAIGTGANNDHLINSRADPVTCADLQKMASYNSLRLLVWPVSCCFISMFYICPGPVPLLIIGIICCITMFCPYASHIAISGPTGVQLGGLRRGVGCFVWWHCFWSTRAAQQRWFKDQLWGWRPTNQALAHFYPRPLKHFDTLL